MLSYSDFRESFQNSWKRQVSPLQRVLHSTGWYPGIRIRLCLCCENDRCSDKGKKCSAKSLWLSSEISYQEVFCANNIVGNSVVELT